MDTDPAFTPLPVPPDAAAAEALEAQARARLAEADPAGAAQALLGAAARWQADGAWDRLGTCWLLAASSLRLAGDLDGAARVVADAAGLEEGVLPPALVRGFELERAEQILAQVLGAQALAAFTAFVDRHGPTLGPLVLAQVLQRRAAAATAAGEVRLAAADLEQAGGLLAAQGHAVDALAARLAGASVLAQADAPAAEARWRMLAAAVPADGAAAARRGLVGGHIAACNGDWRQALQRFDAARQGALDARDAMAYWPAALRGAEAAEQLGDSPTAYARLATAWVTLGDLLGRDVAAGMVRPALLALRQRLGPAAFQAARQAHERTRHRA